MVPNPNQQIRRTSYHFYKWYDLYVKCRTNLQTHNTNGPITTEQVWRGSFMQRRCPSVCLFDCLPPTRNCRPLADWNSSAQVLAPVCCAANTTGVPYVSTPWKTIPVKLVTYLFVASINALHLLPPTKEEEVNAFARVCLSVCLSVSKITQKRVHGFRWNVACRHMSGHGRTD